MIKKFYSALPAIILSTLIVVALVLAWTEPTSPPPSGNVPAPLNTGDTGQWKTGTLRLGGLRTDSETWLATESGNVGIGTTTPAYKLDVKGSINAEKIYVQGSELVTGTAITYVISISTPISGGVINSKSSSWTCPVSGNVVNISKSATYDSCCSYSISGSTITVNVQPYVWVDKCFNSGCTAGSCVGCAGYCTASVSASSWCASGHPSCAGAWGWGLRTPYSNSCTVEFQCATKISVGS